jgi:hypothetical protein
LIVKFLPWSVVQEVLDLLNLFLGNGPKVSFLGEELTDQSVDLFNPSFLVGTVGIAVKGIKSVGLPKLVVESGFTPTVKGNGLREPVG